MNREKRSKLKEAMGYLNKAHNLVSAVIDAEQTSMDNLPKSLQESDMYYSMEEAVEDLEHVATSIEDTIDALDLVAS